MNNINKQLLESIKDEAAELLGFADAGGDTEQAFDLTADTAELRNIQHTLLDFGGRIRGELQS